MIPRMLLQALQALPGGRGPRPRKAAMYKECRHILPNGNRCRSAALAGSHWCYFHSRLHQQEDRRRAGLRAADGRFRTPTEADRAQAAPEEQTIDRGIYPVGSRQAASAPQPEPDPGPICLPTIEDNASIQLALIEILHALADNRLDTKRAGLLLYGLQVASQNVKHLGSRQLEVRSLTYAENGAALSPEEHGYDLEDNPDTRYEDDDEEDEEA